jgi:sensor c-di-GMP phosphodiesterase-like protein
MKSIDQIRSGFENSEFFLEYLPIMSFLDGKCVGAEVLLRWKHFDELIPPLDIIPAIKNTPLLGLITYWMIEQVGREMGDLLHSEEKIHIGINAPPELIGRGGIAYAISKAGLLDVAHKITLEITERGLLDQTALDAINAKALSCKIAVDDFGTGDANLLQLSKIEADIIKIDKAFIGQITTDRWVSRMISGLSAFASVLGTELIAEGVESKSQVELLKSLGVRMGQGIFFSKSINAEAFLDFYSKNKIKVAI